MPARTFDDPDLRDALRAYVRAADALDEAAAVGDEPRALMDLAEAKTMAGLALRKRLTDLGWSAPVTESAPPTG